jgi:DNA-binding protein H-NS
MNDAQLNKLSYNELLNLKNKIDVAKAQKKVQERAALKAKIADMAATSGFDVAELFGGNTTRKSSGKVAVKYANPKDPTQTWTGRGRKPLWMVAELKKGKKQESFAL